MSIENSWPVSGAGYRRCEIRKEKKERKATRRWTEKMRGRVEVTRASSSSRGSRRTTLRSLCIFARLLSSSLLSYPRLVVSHALYLDACRRVLAARACSRARASQKYVILFLYIYIYLCARIYVPTEVSLPFDRDVWSLVKPFRDPMLRNFVPILSTAYPLPLRLMADSRNFVKK